jgi:PHD/YefM family antitoxin component YafN of YafNO toxin-antitoxin module
MNSITAAELKRRGMAAIEEGLRRGPVHLVKRNRASAVVLSADEYARLAPKRNKKPAGMTAVQWLLAQATTGKRRKRQIDKSLRVERKSWV